MARKRVVPEKDEVSIVYVFPGYGGFRYTCRDHLNKVVYDSPRGFRSRYDARDEIERLWPQARISFEYQ